MTQIACVLHLFIIGNISFQKISVDTGQNLCHIFVNKLTVICSKHVVGAAFLVQTKCERTVFVCITEGKFHFIAVSEFDRTAVDTFPLVVCAV